MKLAKLSLAAIVVAGLSTSSFAADTLEGAFKEGKVTGALKAYYWDRDNAANVVNGTVAGSADIFNTGLMLNYVTGSFHGLSLGFTGQANAAPFASSKAKGETTPVYTANFAGDEYGSGAVLSEAYVAYSMKNTTALVGRMFLETPLVASSGSRMVKEAFEGVAVINKDLPNTTLIAGYVQKFQSRTDGNGKVGNFTKTFSAGLLALPLDDGAYTLAAINKSVPGLTLTAAYADAIDAAKIVYLEAAYEGKVSGFTYGLAAQYYNTNYDSQYEAPNLVEDSSLFGLKATLGMGPVTGTLAYSSVGNDGVMGVTPGLGNGADLIYTGSAINSFTYLAGTDAYKIGVDYAITSNASIGASYVGATTEVLGLADVKQSYVSLIGSYSFDGALKGLSLDVIYDKAGKDVDAEELRVQAAYKF